MPVNDSTSVNGTHPVMMLLLLCVNPASRRIGETIAYCLLFVISQVGNTLIVIIVHKKKTMRNPINILIVKTAASDLLYPILLFPKNLAEVHLHSSLTKGGLGEAFCKLAPFSADVSTVV